MATAEGRGRVHAIAMLPQLATRSAAVILDSSTLLLRRGGSNLCTPARVGPTPSYRKRYPPKTYAITTATAALNETIGHPFTGALVTEEPSVIHVMIVSPCGSTIDVNLFQWGARASIVMGGLVTRRYNPDDESSIIGQKVRCVPG